MMTDKDMVKAAVDRIADEVLLSEACHEGFTARDIQMMILGEYGQLIPEKTITGLLINNFLVDTVFMMKVFPRAT